MSEQQKLDQERADFDAAVKRHLEINPEDWQLTGWHDDEGSWAFLGWQLARASLPVGVPDGWKLVGHQFQGRDGNWNQFMDQRHYENTKADGSWPIREIYTPAAQPAAEQSAPGEVEEVEVVAHMWQHDETGRVGFVDQQQVDWGFEKNNPRLHLCGPLMTVAQHKRIVAQLAARDAGVVRVPDSELLDFILQDHRKVVVERLPHDNFEVYVEEGFMGDKRYPGVRYSGEWEQGSPEALEIQREAIDAALLAQRERGGE